MMALLGHKWKLPKGWFMWLLLPVLMFAGCAKDGGSEVEVDISEAETQESEISEIIETPTQEEAVAEPDPVTLAKEKLMEKAADLEALFGVPVTDGVELVPDSIAEEVLTATVAGGNGETLTLSLVGGRLVGAKLQSNVDPEGEPMSNLDTMALCREKLGLIQSVLDMRQSYELSDGGGIDDTIEMFYATRILENGLKNDGESINIVLDRAIGRITQIRGFDYHANTETPVIDEEEARAAAIEYAGGDAAVTSAKLCYVDPNLYRLGENVVTTQYHLAYEIGLDVKIHVIIDAVSGEKIGAY